ncbi:carcinine hydrolase/isopenicillin-N N-acyltransferase family protein [Bremerella sp. JC817]|uniref:carcinine hydrolase/isopenicillin-N N-acyltransferase family protein n=1 Tax=Bremerella sp. JC817 TaxID=3231756 RepID=UPI003457C569
MPYRLKPLLAAVVLAFATLPLMSSNSVQACTTAVISGRATSDGRPILWKNRDTRDTTHQEILQLTEGKHRAIGVVNAGKTNSVWMGVNEAGFCIENSVARDLAIPGKKSGLGNGGLMKRALETCATVAEFKQLLEETDETGRTTIGNFGVIDGAGGAAMFEVGPKSHVMYDANDPETAPDGIVVRANFATTVRDLPIDPTADQLVEVPSQDRYRRACSLLKPLAGDKISVAYVLRNCTRDLSDSKLAPLPGSVNLKGNPLPPEIDTANTISRSFTVSAAVFHGVLPDEDPRLTTMWTILGEPIFSLAVPCFAATTDLSPELVGKRGAPINELANSLRTWNYFPEAETLRGDGLPDLWKELWATEDQLLAETLQQRDAWQTAPFTAEELTAFQKQQVETAYGTLRAAFLATKNEALTRISAPLPDFTLATELSESVTDR